MERNENPDLSKVNLTVLLTDLAMAQAALRTFVDAEEDSEGEGIQFVEAYYHVTGAINLLNDPEVFAAVEAILAARRPLVHPAAAALQFENSVIELELQAVEL